MLDLKRLRQEPEIYKNSLAKRNPSYLALIDELLETDEDYRKQLQERQDLEARRNSLSKLVGQKKSKGENADEEIKELNLLKEKLKEIAEKEPEILSKQESILFEIPNLPSESVPEGKSEEDNLEIYKWGETRKFDFQVLDHEEIGRKLDVLDFERGVKLAQSRFTLVKGLGAKLERALINFMLDKAFENGYTEISPPLMVNSNSLYGTGQLPKFSADLYKIEAEDLYLIPTAEVPLTNIYNDEILRLEDLNISITAFTPCFRSEAGAASRDTRGIIRQHQFSKIELVKITKPEDSEEEHEKLTKDAESILQALGLPYRKVLLCSGDMGFSAQKCYDLEVWFPSQNKYREISSCSNFGDFQARRAKIRFKRDSQSKAELVHTINGSGLAVGRTMAAIMENYQNADASFEIPEVLKKYF
jgi:seryl-tRNA synthetase